jgi:L-histidine Nalpha-methyltransferase
MDLVKDKAVIEAAYNDSAGVTAAFNRNVLHVVNRELDGDLPVDDFAHRALWNPAGEWIEMHLVATRPIRATPRAIDLALAFAPGEHIVTEYSCKFRVGHVRRELAAAGLAVTTVVTDPQEWFALVLAQSPADTTG